MRSVIQFLNAQNVWAIEIHRQITAVYGEGVECSRWRPVGSSLAHYWRIKGTNHERYWGKQILGHPVWGGSFTSTSLLKRLPPKEYFSLAKSWKSLGAPITFVIGGGDLWGGMQKLVPRYENNCLFFYIVTAIIQTIIVWIMAVTM